MKTYSTVEAADKAGITGAPSGVGKTFRRLAAKLGLVPTKEKGALCWTEADIAEVKANYKPRAKRTATIETPAISANNNETDGSENIIDAPNDEVVTTAQVGEPTNAPVVEETATVETVDVPPAEPLQPVAAGACAALKGAYTMKTYRINPVVKENEPVKYNRVDIRFEKCGLIRIDGYFEAKRIETAYNRLCRALEQAAADMPALNGWKELPAKKLVQTENGTWENENGDTIFYTDPQDALVVEVQDNNTFYIYGNYKMELNGINPADVPLADDNDTEPAEVDGKTITPAVAETASVTAAPAPCQSAEPNERFNSDNTTNGGAVQQVISAEAYKKIDVAAKMVALCKRSDTFLETELKNNDLLADNYDAFAEELKATKDYKTEYKACLQRYLDQFNVIVAEPVKTEPPAQKPVVDAEPFISCYAPEPAKPAPVEPAPVEVKEPVKPSKPKPTDKPAPLEPPAEDNFVRTQDRIKSCPVNLRLPEDYVFSEDGIELVVRGKKGDKYICAARTPIIPTKIFLNPLNGKVEYEFSILVFGKWAKVEVDGAVLGDRELTRILNGHGALIDKPPILSEFINAVIKLNAGILPRPKSYNQTGWTSEEFEDFAFPANGKSVVRREGYDYDRILRPHGNREEWKKKFSEVVTQGGARVKTIIGFACAAFLVRPLGLPNLQLHVHGRKSIGKTPTEQFAVSAFGNPTIHGLSYSFASTPKARLEMATAFSDFPTICEELESISKRDAEKIPQDVYQFFMGTSGQALKKDGSLRETKHFSGARFTSGEHSLVQSFGNAGEFKRVLELRCNSLLDEEFASDLYGFCAKNHGLFLEDWTRYIIEHKDTINKDYNQLLKYICADQKDNGTERDRTQLSTLVISSVAYQHFKIATGLQQEFDHHEFEDVTNTVATEMQSAEELDDTTRAAEELSSYVASHEKNFAHEKANGEDEPAWGATCFGIIYENGEVAFHPTELRRILKDELGFISASKLIGEWHDKDKLIVNGTRKDHVIKIGKKTYKAIHFKANVVATSIDSVEEKYYEDLGAL